MKRYLRSCLLRAGNKNSPDIHIGAVSHDGRLALEIVNGDEAARCDGSLVKAFELFGHPADNSLGVLSPYEMGLVNELVKRTLAKA